MGEAIISRGYSGSGGSSGGESGILKTEIFKQSDVFIVPKAKDQSFSVRIFGGGGGGASIHYQYNITVSYNCYAGGGGGWMNNDVLILNQGDQIPISIGPGGNGSINTAGDDEAHAKVGGTTSFGTYLSALGGDGGDIANYLDSSGGNGGSGGGAYCKYSSSRSTSGNGFQFGGGGGYGQAGKGGKWGGGGGTSSGTSIAPGGCLIINGKLDSNNKSGLAGNGGNNRTAASNGTNTIDNNDIEILLQGYGYAGTNNYTNPTNNMCYGGGGGYGGCGGHYAGGGGGYGANGGNYYGGGGGYGGHGGDNCGGGGGYGSGGSSGSDGVFGGGGGAWYQSAGNGGDGICIIQYYPE